MGGHWGSLGPWGVPGAFSEVCGDPQVGLEEPKTVEILGRNEHGYFFMIFVEKLVSGFLVKKHENGMTQNAVLER